jgi:hypothetical protein
MTVRTTTDPPEIDAITTLMILVLDILELTGLDFSSQRENGDERQWRLFSDYRSPTME